MYPPPEDERISYEEIKRRYREQNIVVKAEPVNKQNEIKKEGIADKVKRWLNTGVSKKPDNQHFLNVFIVREVYIEEFIPYSTDGNIGVNIKVIPQNSETGEALHSNTFRVDCSRNPVGQGDGSRAWRALQESLSSLKGQKARIGYIRIPKNGGNRPSVQLIAPIGSDVIYLRENKILKPYNIQEMRFIGV